MENPRYGYVTMGPDRLWDTVEDRYYIAEKVAVEKKIVQLLVQTNLPALNDVEDPPKIWMDTSYVSLTIARNEWPEETYREVEVTE